jgi:hypothetical protein
MGLFGIFDTKAGGNLRKHAERATNKRAQAVDRWESIQFLLRQGTGEAVEALLPRFAFYVDPSITDQEEKDAAFDGILRVGAAARPPVIAFMAKSESLSWPLKLLDRLMAEDEVVGVLLALLNLMDVEYERDPQRKIQLLSALEERPAPTTAAAVARFLGDANETVRFHAVGAVFAQQNAVEQRAALLGCLCGEESVRVRNRILDGFVNQGWDVADRLDQARAHLTPGYAVDARGVLKRLG